MVTRSNRYPLLIDPQEQGMEWIKNMYRDSFDPKMCQSNLNNKSFKDVILMYCLEQGKTLLIVGIENEVDSILDPILEKQIIRKGKHNQYILIQESQFQYNDKFNMFLFCRLPNPHFSPELSAKTTIIDFTVT